jgi:hypothetical protein
MLDPCPQRDGASDVTDSRLGAGRVGRHLIDVGAVARAVAGRRCGDHTLRSHPHEGVVTEVGEDVAGVPHDLAGLR